MARKRLGVSPDKKNKKLAKRMGIKTGEGELINIDNMESLVELGHTNGAAVEALKLCNNDMDTAIELLEKHPEFADLPDPTMKKKKKPELSPSDEENAAPDADNTMEEEEPVAEVVTEEKTKKKKKKKKPEMVAMETEEAEEEVAVEEPKKKKKKRKQEPEAEVDSDESPEEVAVEEPPKKKKKKKKHAAEEVEETTKEKSDEDQEAETEKENVNLFCGNLDADCTADDLKEFFEENDVTVKEARKGDSKRFGYVEIDAADEETALALNGKEWNGQEIKVDKARPRAPLTPRGGFGGRGWKLLNGRKTPLKSNQIGGRGGDRGRGGQRGGRGGGRGGENNAPTDTLFVGNLSWDTTEDTLRDKFEGCTQCRLPMNEDGRPKGFAFIQFDSVDDAKKSHQANLEAEVDGRTIRVDFSTPKSDRGGGGRGGGGFGGRGGGRGGFGRGGGRGGRGGGSGGGDGCFKCGESGHFSRECPKGGGGGSSCYKCGEEGHISRDCPKGGGSGCFKCGEEGHISRECPKGGGSGCFKCGENGHISRDCPQGGGGGGRGGGFRGRGAPRGGRGASPRISIGGGSTGSKKTFDDSD